MSDYWHPHERPDEPLTERTLKQFSFPWGQTRTIPVPVYRYSTGYPDLGYVEFNGRWQDLWLGRS